jgi:hypothetical protein
VTRIGPSVSGANDVGARARELMTFSAGHVVVWAVNFFFS